MGAAASRTPAFALRKNDAARERISGAGAGAGRAAWLVLLPCAAVAVAAILLLGPPLGRSIFPARSPFTFWPEAALTPKPTEEARYLLALGAPLLLALATVAALPRLPAIPSRAAAAGVAVVQALGVAFVVVCVAGQHTPRWTVAYFDTRTLCVAAAIALLVVATVRAAPLRRRAAAALRERTSVRVAAVALAGAMTAIWLLPAINTDRSIAWAHFTAQYHVAFSLDETFAVLNGLTPLVSFSAQYGSLWPFAVALPMLAFGKTLLVFSIAMTSITGLAMLAVFGVLRRAARSALAGLLLFLPFLASGFFRVDGTLAIRHEFGTYFPMFPLRYGGPYLLAWFVARRLDGRERAPPWPLFLVAGLVVLNNTDFGVSAFGATIAALLWTGWARRRSIARLVANVALGLAAAYALVSVLTLVRAGALPDPARVVEFARIYGVGGFNAIRLPSAIGLPLVIYLTYCAAIATATVRALAHEPNRVLTGMLAWVGVFGLGSADYYMARSYYEVMPYLFSAWTLALALLAIVVVRRLAERPRRLPSAAALAVLFGVGVAACSLAQTPIPWGQLHRIATPPASADVVDEPGPYMPSTDPAVRRFVSSIAAGPHRFAVRRGAPVALFMTLGHRIADAYGIADVLPYTGIDSVDTTQQLDRAIAALRAAGGNTIVLPGEARPPIVAALLARGFVPATRAGAFAGDPRGLGPARALAVANVVGGMTKWVDRGALGPRTAPATR
jgi:hypothetical protein